MPRVTGKFRTTVVDEEEVRAFVPYALPPSKPPLRIEADLDRSHSAALDALGRLAVAGDMVPSANWFLYGFLRKEAVVSSQIEGTQATLQDVLTYEATRKADRPAEVEEVCNYIEALEFVSGKSAKPPNGKPPSSGGNKIRNALNYYIAGLVDERAWDYEEATEAFSSVPGVTFGVCRGPSGVSQNARPRRFGCGGKASPVLGISGGRPR